ncbi:SDR family NAD(P)-dependent oxidoreductase [Rathayibacter sp. VKM Ac-2857]|uniref:SDR family NAD(P)-dependent oxidoreductase n=1 Tax=Rathayibacter sp. VKM Ac-2857 TaxID=2739020 RepID=UPI001566D033|nr:SDR family NAD(P)-dependent oxidoreductase [Rathayibacter sp. VKM Ac-2857]NQX17989.1 SDR family NAD(P)-dependent oxidoreductase [Rathayibacter sp. VKM Ac-2857]
MADTNVWFITGAGRGMGVDIARAALAAGHQVVATGRDADRVRSAIGDHENLLAVSLDITDPAAAESAVATALGRFGRIDVLVNNAGNFYAGYFETLSDAQMRAQFETNFFGALTVTRTVLPHLRAQRSGQIITITSTAGFVGGEFTSAYAASKFALEGWMESLQPEVAHFGISAMAVEPGFFRTELLVEGSSTIHPEIAIDDYAEWTEQTLAVFAGMNGTQPGDPAKLARALVTLSDSDELPARFIAGGDAAAAIEQKQAAVQQQIDAHRALSESLAHDA